MATSQKINPDNIGKVRVNCADGKGGRKHIGMYEESRLILISLAARKYLPGQQVIPKELHLPEVNVNAAQYVLTGVLHYGDKLRLNVNAKSMIEVIFISEILEMLEIVPKQPQVEGFLVHQLTHSAVSVEAMLRIHRLYGPKPSQKSKESEQFKKSEAGRESKAPGQSEEAKRDEHRVWRVMVHQIAWDYVHGNLTAEAQRALNTASARHATLDEAIMERIAHLYDCQDFKDKQAQQHIAKQGQKQAAKTQASKQRKKKADYEASKINKKVKDHRAALQEKREHKWYEEEQGLRPVSEETVQYLMHQAPKSFWVKTKVDSRQIKKAEESSEDVAGSQAAVVDREGREGDEGDAEDDVEC